MTTVHSTAAGPTPAATTPDQSPEDGPAPAALRPPARPQHDGADTHTLAPSGRPTRMNLELASRLLSSSRWLQ
ncbi:MAG TPA: hypothetical protein VK891_18385 [Euzebyales bacterium]|nr:hypothetical protein [Euzebyales bacterium]